MEETVLKAQPRTVIGKQVKALRREGKLPAVLYGSNIQPIPIVMELRETSRILAGVSSSHLITIDLDGEKYPTLVREKQRNWIKGVLTHIDFLVVSLTEKLRAEISVVLHGEAPAVADLHGVLVTGQESLEVECLPRDLPEHITVDISSLDQIGDAIYVRDIVLPPQVQILTPPDEMIVLVTAPAAEEVEEAVVVEGAEEPEVIERGKKEDEEF